MFGDVLEQRDADHAIEGVNANLAIGPVVHRAPTEPVAIFESAEDLLDPLLAGIGGNDLFSRPIQV